MASKRPIVSEGNTPGKPANKRVPVEGSSRKSLFSDPNSVPSISLQVQENGQPKYSIFVYFGRTPGLTDGP